MSKTIMKLWNGELDPIRYLGTHNTEIKHLETLMQRNLEKLVPSVGKATATVLDAYTDCVDEYATTIAEQAFCDGFSLGAKLVAEALTKSEK